MAQSTNEAASAAKAWWHALTFGDTTYLKNNSTKDLTVTLSIGTRFNLKGIVMQASKHNPTAKIVLDWSEEVLQQPNPQTAIVIHRMLEKVGAGVNPLRYMTVLIKDDAGWKVTAAQSTKETELSPRIPTASAGRLEDYAGNYRTPAGTTLRAIVRDTSLILIDHSGVETILEAIGPGIFEPPHLHMVGNVRIIFSRDSMGRVIALNRLANKVISMPRIL
jgi:hypothetical protein